MLGVCLEVADVGLGVTAGSVQEDQRRPVGVAGVQVARAHPAGVEVAL